MSTFVVSLFLPFTVNFLDKQADTEKQEEPDSLDQLTYLETVSAPTSIHRHSSSFPVDLRRLSAPSALAVVQTSSALNGTTPGALPDFPQSAWIIEPPLKPLLKLKSSTNLADLGALRIDNVSPGWGKSGQGSYFAQPTSRARSPPPASVLKHKIIEDIAPDEIRFDNKRYRSTITTSDNYGGDASFTIEPSAIGNGALTIALDAAAARQKRAKDTIWVGTLGMPTNALGASLKNTIKERLAVDFESVTVYVDDTDLVGLYDQYSKTILWPSLHYHVPDQVKSKAYEDDSWKFYKKVNEVFADVLIENWKRGDTIWVHDYHLMLVPELVRRRIPDAEIGFFMHSPFPSSEIFRCFATRRELITGLLGANLVSFQTDEYVGHFLGTCTRLLNVEATRETGVILSDGRVVHTSSNPMGIDPHSLNILRSKRTVENLIDQFADQYQGKKLIVARDRLDVTRGVDKKFLIFEQFLKLYPELRKDVVLVQIATPAPGDTTTLANTFEIMSRINSKYSTLTHSPIVFLAQDVPYDEWLALMNLADCLLVTSRREGMNLTGHEFVVCQDGLLSGKKHAPLILSEFTGAASIFKDSAFLVNPWDHKKSAETIFQALTMNEIQREERWRQLRRNVDTYNALNWYNRSVVDLDTAYKDHSFRDITSVPRCSLQSLMKKYERTDNRLLLLDYEGTLTNWGSPSSTMSPSSERVLDILTELARDKKNVVYVMSGRSRFELNQLFSTVMNIGLIAENGSFIRHAESAEWTVNCDLDHAKDWKSGVLYTLDYYKHRVSGSRIEELETSIYFRYDEAEDMESAERTLEECANFVTDVCLKQKVRAVPTEKAIYISNIDTNKSTAADVVMEKVFPCGAEAVKPLNNFLLVIGNSREDEYVFDWARRLNSKRFKEWQTITVGQRNTAATSVITQGVTGVLSTLRKLAFGSAMTPIQTP